MEPGPNDVAPTDNRLVIVESAIDALSHVGDTGPGGSALHHDGARGRPERTGTMSGKNIALFFPTVQPWTTCSGVRSGTPDWAWDLTS